MTAQKVKDLKAERLELETLRKYEIGNMVIETRLNRIRLLLRGAQKTKTIIQTAGSKTL